MQVAGWFSAKLHGQQLRTTDETDGTACTLFAMMHMTAHDCCLSFCGNCMNTTFILNSICCFTDLTCS